MSDPPLKQPVPENPTPPQSRRNPSLPWLLLVVAAVVVFIIFNRQGVKRSEINYGFLYQQLAGPKCNIAKVEVQGAKVLGEFVNPPPNPEGKKDREGKSCC